MRRLLVSLWLGVWSLSALAVEPITIVRGDGDYFPKEYIEHGKLKGLHIDMLHAVANDLNLAIKFESLPWKRAIEELRKGNFHAITYISRNEERDNIAWFLKGNIISSATVHPIVLKERKSEIRFDGSMESLQPYIIAVGDGYRYGEPFDSADFLTRYILPSPNQETLTELLRLHRVDVIISSRRNLLKVYSSDEVDRSFHVFEQPAASDHSYIAFSKARGTKSLATTFAKAISQYKSTNEYLELLDFYRRLEEER